MTEIMIAVYTMIGVGYTVCAVVDRTTPMTWFSAIIIGAFWPALIGEILFRETGDD